MSVFGNTSAGSQTGGQYGRADLQSAFNWLIHQPEHVRKQATDPDRLMTLFFRSQGSASSRPEPQERMETAAPVSSLNFISDLRQINEAMRQFDGPSAVSQMISTGAIPAGVATGVAAGVATVGNGAAVHTPVPPPPTAAGLHTKTLTAIAEVREKLNLSSDTEAVNLLISIGVKAIRPLLG